jgi:serine/threonine protein kinase/Tol biopolymer transport system component
LKRTRDADLWHKLCAVVERFESAWKTGAPSLADFVPAGPAELRKECLVELLRIDMEKRGEAGEGMRLEACLHDWPELRDDSEVLIRLLESECMTRAWLGEPPDRRELQERFPDLADQVDLEAVLAEASQESPEDTASDADATSDGPTKLLTNRNAVQLQPEESFGAGDRYEILRLLGSGGMGSVYLARDTRLGRNVAIKIPDRDTLSDPTLVARFQREAQTLASLTHPRICQVFDVDQWNDIHFLTMEFVAGTNLDAWSQQHTLTPPDAASIVCRLAGAVAALHEAGTVHRDIKSSNVMIRPDGEPVLMDFGLARGTSIDQQITSTGSLLGTPAYMPPEVIDHGAASATERSDVYSLGVLLYRLLTGSMPFTGTLTQVLVQIGTQPPPPIRDHCPDVDGNLESICLNCLEKDPLRRPATAGELRDRLQEWLETRAVSVRDAGDSAGRVTRRTALVVLAVVVIGVAATLSLGPDPAGEADSRIARDKPAEPPRSLDDSPPPAVQKNGQEENPLPPLSFAALVPRPAPLPDIQSWSLETRHHRGAAWAGAFSPDGSLLATGGEDAAIRIYDYDSAELKHILIGHDDVVTDLVWSPDDTWLAVGSQDGTVTVWNPYTGKLLRRLAGYTKEWIDLALTTDGEKLAVYDRKVLQIFETDEWGEIQWLKADAMYGYKSTVSWAPDNHRMATVQSANFRVFSWDQPLAFQDCHDPHTAISVAWSPAGEIVASASQPGGSSIHLWDVAANKSLGVLDHENAISTIHFSPDGRHLISAGHQNRIRVWDTSTKEKLTELTLAGGGRGSHCLGVSPDGTSFVCGGYWGQVDAFDLKTAAPLRRFSEPVAATLNSAGWSPDSRRIATVDNRYTVRVWDRLNGELLGIRTRPAEQGSMASVVWDAKRNALLVPCGRGGPNLWSFEVTDRGDMATPKPIPVDIGDRLAISPDGNRLAALSGGLTIVDLANETISGVFVTPNEGRAVAWSPDGALIATGHHDTKGGVRIWKPGQAEPLQQMPGIDQDWILSLAWSPDGRFVASGSRDPDIRIWDARSGQLHNRLKTQNSTGISTIDWTSDGRLIAVSRDAELFEWDVATGQRLRTVRGIAPGEVSPGGWSIASVDGTRRSTVPATMRTFMRIHDLESLEPEITMVPLADERWLAVTPDGRIRGSDGIEDEIVYVVETRDGQETLSHDAFVERFGADEDRTPMTKPIEESGGDHKDAALRFNGRNSYVEIPSFRFDGSHPLTVEALVRIGKANTEADIISCTEQSGFALRTTAKGVQFMASPKAFHYTTAQSEDTFAGTQAVHFAGVLDPDREHISLFADGQLVAKEEFDRTFNASRFPLMLGCSPPAPGYAFAGEIDEVRVSRVVRYTEEFEPESRFNSDADTLALYHCDEGRGSILHDSSENNHRGRIVAAEWVPGLAR